MWTSILDYLSKCSKRQIKHFMEQADSKMIQLLSDLCLNFNKGHLTRDQSYIRRLRPYAKLIKNLCQRSISIKKRRKVLQTGGFASVLLSTLVPLLLSLFNKMLQLKTSDNNFGNT